MEGRFHSRTSANPGPVLQTVPIAVITPRLGRLEMGLRGGVVSSGADHHEYTPVARWAVSPVMKTTTISSDGDRVISRYLSSSDLLSPI
jgi:hypothetical protein